MKNVPSARYRETIKVRLSLQPSVDATRRRVRQLTGGGLIIELKNTHSMPRADCWIAYASHLDSKIY